LFTPDGTQNAPVYARPSTNPKQRPYSKNSICASINGLTTPSTHQRGTLEYFEMNQKIDLAMMDVLWKTQRISNFGIPPG
jgi:hypothetical protein